jgi:hypothetical protein
MFIKQCYQLEDIRLLAYIRLQNMMALVMAVAYFTSPVNTCSFFHEILGELLV